MVTFHNRERSIERSLRMAGMINFIQFPLLAWKKLGSNICEFGKKNIKLFKYSIDGQKVLEDLKKLCLVLKKELLCKKKIR